MLGLLAVAVFVLALFPALGYELVRVLDREQRLTNPARWVAGGLIGVIAFGAVGSIAPSPSSQQAAALLPVSTRASEEDRRTPEPLDGVTPPTPAPTKASPASSEPPVPGPPFGKAPQGPTETAHVVRVIDGDTIVIDRGLGEERVRYIGVDSPELDAADSFKADVAKRATRANRTLVAGMEVVLERDVSETDFFDRLLRYVWIRDPSKASGWLFVNLELVRRGYAQVVTYPPDVRYVDLFRDAQRKARNQDVGLWAPEPDPTPRPDSGNDNCHPSYEGACLKRFAGDYDCAGGSGDGPNYVQGPVRVVGYDEFGLDSDNDGIGCES